MSGNRLAKYIKCNFLRNIKTIKKTLLPCLLFIPTMNVLVYLRNQVQKIIYTIRKRSTFTHNPMANFQEDCKIQKHLEESKDSVLDEAYKMRQQAKDRFCQRRGALKLWCTDLIHSTCQTSSDSIKNLKFVICPKISCYVYIQRNDSLVNSFFNNYRASCKLLLTSIYSIDIVECKLQTDIYHLFINLKLEA